MKVKKLTKAFPLGRQVMTYNAKENVSLEDMIEALKRHATCDWGEVCEADWNRNNQAVECGDRLLSVYTSSNGIHFWIITEWTAA